MAEEVQMFLRKKDYIILKSKSINKSDIFFYCTPRYTYKFPECDNL